MRYARPPSLRLRVLLLVLLALVPALLLLVHRSRLEQEMADAHIRETALRTAQVAALEEELLAGGVRQLLATGAAVVEAEGPRPACADIFRRLAQADHRLADLGAVAPDGTVICSATGRSPRQLADRNYVRDALEEGDFAIGAYQVDDRGGDPTVGFGFPWRDERGRPAGVVFATLRLVWLGPLLERADLPAGATALLLDAQGTLLARRPSGPVDVGTIPSAPQLVQRVRAEREGTILARGPDGIERIYGFTWVPRGEEATGIYVVVGLPVQPALAPLQRVAARDLLLLLVVALAAAAVAWIGGTLVLRPLRSLARATARLRRGELAARVGGVGGPGEIRDLAWSFDAMADSLEQTTDRLRSRADELTAVAAAARALVDDLSLDAVAAVVVAQTRGALQARGCALWQVEDEELLLLAAEGFRSDLSRVTRVPRDAPLAAAVAWRTDRVVRIDDTAHEEAACALAREEGMRSVLAVPLHFRGRTVAILGVTSDAIGAFGQEAIRLATALGDLFAAAVQNAQLFEQVRSQLWLRESFIAAAAHELRSPATSLRNDSLQVQRRLKVGEEDRALIDRLVRSADRAAALARDLVEAHHLIGGAPPEVRAVDLRALAAHVAEEAMHGETGRRVVLAPGGPCPVDVDPDRLAQALRALLELAFRYQPDGGTVAIALESDDSEVRLRVRDEGPGIPPERLPHVFEPLFEPWPAGSPHYIGIVGLGPFLARLVVESHGGRLSIRSALGGGTSTTIHLPVSRRP